MTELKSRDLLPLQPGLAFLLLFLKSKGESPEGSDPAGKFRINSFITSQTQHLGLHWVKFMADEFFLVPHPSPIIPSLLLAPKFLQDSADKTFPFLNPSLQNRGIMMIIIKNN